MADRSIIDRIADRALDSRAGCGEGNVYAEACPSRAILELIADKWTLLILPALRRGPKRNGDLMRQIGGVSQKMLTQTLRDLERNGLVARFDHQQVPPRVDYELTDLGRSLSEAVRKLDSWAENHIPDVQTARAAFEKRDRAALRR